MAVDASSRYALHRGAGTARRSRSCSRSPASSSAAIKYYWFAHGEVASVRATISRTGYTGEDGFEIFVPPQSADRVWQALLESGRPPASIPCGLGARDTLRLEAAMRLYGNDIDETTTALEADLGWIVGWNKGDFLGADVAARAEGRGRRRGSSSASRCSTAASRRHGLRRRTSATRKAGAVTSGTQTPFLKKAIGMAYLPVEHTARRHRVRRRHPRPPHARAGRADAVLQAAERRPTFEVACSRLSDRRSTWRRDDVSGRLQVHEGPRVDRARRRPRPKSASPTTRSSSSATSSTSSCRRSGAKLKQGQSFGTIESVKAVSELYAPVSGEVVEVNTALKDKPEAVNADPHASWMIVIKLADPGEAGALLDADAVRRSREIVSHQSCPAECSRLRAVSVPPHRSRRQPKRDAMLKAIGAPSLEALIDEAIPARIRLDEAARTCPTGSPSTSSCASCGGSPSRNQLFKSFIGLGYYDCITPSVILRNVLENPGWYTPYTPYQAEIAQGRLEALLNFQTMVSDLTGMEVANASLLDEATAAAEAMTMLHRVQSRADRQRRRPGAVLRRRLVLPADDRRAARAGRAARHRAGRRRSATRCVRPTACSARCVQTPDEAGARARSARRSSQRREARGRRWSRSATDLLSLTLLTPPGEMGADVVFGNSQRFGVPLGYGGPHAAFFATLEKHVRQAPGRIIGVSVDAHGNRAYRMALQTREQHIRREKATSNICTAQALLANIAGFYAVYHGPKGLTAIARRVHAHARAARARARRRSASGS